MRLQQLSIRLDVRDYYSTSTYYRLFLPDLFPLVTKAIYLDSDIVVRTDIANMYNIDLGDKFVGCVADASVQIIPEFQKYVETVLGVPYQEYFNAGILLMDFKKLREWGFERKATKLLSHVTFKVAQDQDVLNYLMKDKTLLLDKKWNVMPLGDKIENPHIVHYNLIFKPWKHKDIMYEEYFWDVANKLNIGVYIAGFLNMFPEEYSKKDFEGVEMVKKLCLEECEKADTYYSYLRKGESKAAYKTKSPMFMTVKDVEEGVKENPIHNKAREEILKKIEQYELEGKFDVDAEDDPPFRPLEPHGLDFLRKKFVNRVKTWYANTLSFRYFNHQIKKGNIVIDEIVGIENLKAVPFGAVITANHFHPFDSIPIHKTVKKYTKRKLFKVIREGNYALPGLFGFFMRNCNTIPLSSNLEVLKYTFEAIDTVLQRGDFLLIYPEQSLWWNYRKPKPLKPGAFKFASKNNVPVLPTFITMRDTDKLDADGYPIQAYTLHILQPIYPDPTRSISENTLYLHQENEKMWKELYESVYKTPLTYTTKK